MLNNPYIPMTWNGCRRLYSVCPAKSLPFLNMEKRHNKHITNLRPDNLMATPGTQFEVDE